MKKIKSLMLFAATMLVLSVLFCMNASAAEWIPIKDVAQYSFDEDTGVMIIRGSDKTIYGSYFGVDCYNHYKSWCSCSDREYDDYIDMTEDEAAANAAAKKTKTLIVEEGVKSLGASVFTEFDNVEVVILPQSLTEIPKGAFANLKKLRTVVLSNSTTSIGEAAFYNCTGLQSLYVPDSVKSLGNGAFFCCDSSVVRVPDTAKRESKVLFAPGIENFKVLLGYLNVYGFDGDFEESHDVGVEYYTYDKATGKYTVVGESTGMVFGSGRYEWKINLPTGKVYDFACRMYVVSNGNKIYSEYSDIITYANAPNMPKPIPKVAEVKTTSIKITWSKSANATGYRVFRRIIGTDKWVTIGTTKNLSGTIKNLTPGTTYRFAIRPYTIVDGVVAWSDSYCDFTVSTAPEAPKTKVSSPSKGKVTVSWEAVSGTPKYQLYYKTGNGSYKLYKTYDSAQNITFSNLKSGTKYTFAVRACRTIKKDDDLSNNMVETRYYYSTYTPVTVTVK